MGEQEKEEIHMKNLMPLTGYRQVTMSGPYDVEVHYRDYQFMSPEDQKEFIVRAMINKAAGAMHPNGQPYFLGDLGLAYSVQFDEKDNMRETLLYCVSYSEPGNHPLNTRVIAGITNSIPLRGPPGLIHVLTHFDSRLQKILPTFRAELKERANARIQTRFARSASELSLKF